MSSARLEDGSLLKCRLSIVLHYHTVHLVVSLLLVLFKHPNQFLRLVRVYLVDKALDTLTDLELDLHGQVLLDVVVRGKQLVEVV